MADREVQRRLAAILAADVAGYTRLMEEDTDGTVAAWQDAREDVIKPTVASHSGKIVKLTGDGFLVEFTTVQDAVNCAIAMQGGLASSRLDFRIGINLGDIVDDGEDIHGEGVNIAARLEGLAEPGGIVISGGVYDQVKNRIEADYEDMGPQEVKNVSDPVQAYTVRVAPLAQSADVAAAFERPAIAVLPFDNMSGDPEQEYFTDGLTEDIITGLSSWRQFPVIGRNSSFTFKGKAVKAQDVAEELGARYILEGSVRKVGNRVRVTAQLLDGNTGHHVWAERYDRELEDVFDLQDEITQRITAILVPEIERAEFERSKSKPPASMDAWDYLLQGLTHFNQYTAESLIIAREWFERAVAADPGYARARAYLAYTYHRELLMDASDDIEATTKLLLDHANAAVVLDPNDADTHWILGFGHGWSGNHEAQMATTGRALELNPLHIPACHAHGMALMRVGRIKEAVLYMERAVRFMPKDPRSTVFLGGLAQAYIHTGEYQKAHDAARQAVQAGGEVPTTKIVLLATLGHLGDVVGAKAALEEFNMSETVPSDFGVSGYRRFSNPNLYNSIADGLRKAGIKIEDK